MKSFKFKVLGKSWKAKFLKSRAFYKRFNEKDIAVCEPHEKVIYYNLDYFSEETVRHELTHAFFDEMGYNALELNKSDSEDFSCELVAKHSAEILKLAREVFEHVKDIHPVELMGA